MILNDQVNKVADGIFELLHGYTSYQKQHQCINITVEVGTHSRSDVKFLMEAVQTDLGDHEPMYIKVRETRFAFETVLYPPENYPEESYSDLVETAYALLKAFYIQSRANHNA